MNRILLALVALLLVAVPVHGQTLEAQRFRLSIGPCVISSGNGAPSASNGLTCDTYFDNASGDFWIRQAGTWRRIPGSGTPGTLSRWATSTTLQDSAISESNGVAVVNEAIGSPGFASQVSGWRITTAGAADVRYLFTDELRARIFTADNESVLAGSQRVTKSYSTIAQPFTCPALGAAATLAVSDAASYGNAPVFQTNDWIVIHVLTRTTFGPFSIADCVGTVTGYVDGSGTTEGQQGWTFTRATGANGGTMTGGTVVPVNQLAQDLGVSGNGYVETTALDGPNNQNAPYMQVVTWTGAPTAGNLTARCRYGNVTGMTGVASEYGFLCGDFAGPGHFVRLTNLVGEWRDIPINMFDASSNKVIALDSAGPSFALGNPIPTSYAGSNSGIWMGNDGGTYKVRIGGAAGNRLQWDGATLTVGGDGSGVTNINGGNIQTNTITVGQLLATGQGDNVIRNGTFEGPTAAQALAGWYNEGPGSQMTFGCCGTTGPGALLMPQQANGGGLWTAVSYYAAPVNAGETYILKFDVYSAGGVGAGGLSVFLFSSTSTNTYVRWIRQTASPPDVTSDTSPLLGNPAIPNGWSHWEYTITPPSGARWIAPWFQNTGCYYQIGCGLVALDGVQLVQQIGPGSIKANSITAGQIAAGTITSGQIAAGSITGGNIAGGTITGGNIAGATITGGNIAGATITAGNIAAGTITSGQIAAGTITAGNIAGGTITADKLNVSTLSAISANLGTVNAGTLNSVTINTATITGGTGTFGCATLNGNGISLSHGGGACNWYKFDNASIGMQYDGGAWMTFGGADIQIQASDGSHFVIDGNIQMINGSGSSLRIQGSGPYSLSYTGISGYGTRVLCVNTSGQIYPGTGPAPSGSC